MYATDNGPHMNTWPDGAMTPFRSEKNTNWEGAFRVPLMVRWPGRIPAGVVSNEIVQHHDWLPTFLAAAGDPDIVEKLKQGHEAAGKSFRVHIDGFNLLPYLTGEEEQSPRQGFIYFSDDGDLVALRFDNWKLVFMEQRARGTLELWAEPFVPLRVPKLFNLRTDPFERADVTSNTYWDWYMSKAYMILAAQAIVGQFLATFAEFPPRQKAASFTIDQALEKMEDAVSWGARLMPSFLLARHGDPRGARRLRRDDGRRPSRPTSASPSSTTTARSGARSRCRSSSASSCSGWPRWPSRTSALREKQPWKAAYEKDYAWLGGVIDKHYAGDDTRPEGAHGRVAAGVRGPDRRRVRGGCARRSSTRRPTRRSSGASATARTCRWSSSSASSRATASPASSPPAAAATSCAR